MSETNPAEEPTAPDQPPYFRDPAEAPAPERPAEHVEPDEDEEPGEADKGGN